MGLLLPAAGDGAVVGASGGRRRGADPANPWNCDKYRTEAGGDLPGRGFGLGLGFGSSTAGHGHAKAYAYAHGEPHANALARFPPPFPRPGGGGEWGGRPGGGERAAGPPPPPPGWKGGGRGCRYRPAASIPIAFTFSTRRTNSAR